MDIKKIKLKKNIYTVVLLLVFFIFFNIINNYYINKGIDENFEVEQLMELSKNKTTINILILGDSHAKYSVIPPLLSNKTNFNFAMPGFDYRESYYQLLFLLNNNISVNKIILGLDPHSFSKKIRTEKRLFKNIIFNKYDFISLKNRSILKDELFVKSYINNRFSIIGNGPQFSLYLLKDGKYYIFDYSKKVKINNKSIYCRKNGFRCLNKTVFNNLSLSSLNQLKISSFEKHFDKNIYSLDENSFRYFINILKFSQHKNITIYLVKFPLSKYYIEQLKDNGFNLNNYYETIDKIIVKENISNYYYLDFQNLYDENNLQYFYDLDHLNTIGAINFSKYISLYLK